MKTQAFNGWMVDNKGRCVCVKTEWWAEMLNKGRPKEEMFTAILIFRVNKNAKKDTTLFYRPSGGLGDMLCILPAIEDYIKQRPEEKITIAFPENYLWIFKHIKAILISYKEFKSVGFNVARNRFHKQFFLWCPAGIHEWDTNYKPIAGRLRNFADAIGVSPRRPTLHLAL